MRSIAECFEMCAAVFVIIAFSGTVLFVMATNGGSLPTGEAESGAVLMIFAAIYVLIIGLIAMRPSLILGIPLASSLLLLLLLLTLGSSLWSLHPDVTLRRAIALLFTTVFGIYLALRWDLPRLLGLIVVALTILLALSYVFVFALPAVGVDHFLHEGAWKGVFFQKNVTGRILVWLILSVLWLRFNGHGPRWTSWIILALAFLMLVMCRSGTGLLSCILVAGVLVAVPLLRGNAGRLVLILAFSVFMAIVTGVGAMLFYEDVLELLGRDVTLTGRTEIWSHTALMLRDHWLLGYGYGAFWYGNYGPGAAFTEGWHINTAHNGWIDVLLDVGTPGLLLVSLVLLQTIVGAVLVARYRDPRNEASWILAVALGLVAISVSESIFLERHSLNWVVLVVGLIRVVMTWRGWVPISARLSAQHWPAGSYGVPQAR